MKMCLQFGVDELSIHGDLKATAVRRYEGDRFYVRLELLQKFSCQTDSSRSVVSDSTVDQFDFKH